MREFIYKSLEKLIVPLMFVLLIIGGIMAIVLFIFFYIRGSIKHFVSRKIRIAKIVYKKASRRMRRGK